MERLFVASWNVLVGSYLIMAGLIDVDDSRWGWAILCLSIGAVDYFMGLRALLEMRLSRKAFALQA